MPPTADTDDIDAPSLVQQIAALEVGKSFSQARRIDGDEATKDAITDARERMRNTLAAAVRRARERTGAAYTVEGGEIFTRSLDVICAIVVTRTE